MGDWNPTGAARITPVARTAAAGVGLINNTQTFLSWTSPNDGQLHPVLTVGVLIVSVLEVGGAISITYTLAGVQATHTVIAAAQAAGNVPLGTGNQPVVIDPNTTVSLTQSSALTGGSSILYATLLAA